VFYLVAIAIGVLIGARLPSDVAFFLKKLSKPGRFFGRSSGVLQAHEAPAFPPVKCTTLAGTKLELPKGWYGKVTLVMVGFRQAAYVANFRPTRPIPNSSYPFLSFFLLFFFHLVRRVFLGPSPPPRAVQHPARVGRRALPQARAAGWVLTGASDVVAGLRIRSVARQPMLDQYRERFEAQHGGDKKCQVNDAGTTEGAEGRTAGVGPGRAGVGVTDVVPSSLPLLSSSFLSRSLSTPFLVLVHLCTVRTGTDIRTDTRTGTRTGTPIHAMVAGG